MATRGASPALQLDGWTFDEPSAVHPGPDRVTPVASPSTAFVR
jgi:hypothetical protein